MHRKESRQQLVTRVSREIDGSIREQARGRWRQVRTADRNEPGRHVWRFQEGPGKPTRFLHVEHRAMAGGDAAQRLLGALDREAWLDRLHDGPHAALLLSRDGQLSPYAG